MASELMGADALGGLATLGMPAGSGAEDFER